jgi:inositol-phosphate transport system permease protein
LADRARARRRFEISSIFSFLVVVSVPLVIPYVGLIVMAFASRDPEILWRAIAVLAPWAVALWIALVQCPSRRSKLAGCLIATLVAALLLTVLIGSDLHLQNFRFLIERPRPSLPSFWSAFSNSAILALSQTAIVTTVAAMAGYYLSRFSFPARGSMLGALLVVHAFPVMTLIIPLFLMIYWMGLLNSLIGVIFVLVALELPFAIFIMKGFFDAVPWDIEMSAIIDGATRRQAFVRIVLPQVTNGLIAISIFAFIRGWEEYIFVSTFLLTQSKWVLSLYLFFENNSAAVALVYLAPPFVLFLLTQKYLMNLSVGSAHP